MFARLLDALRRIRLLRSRAPLTGVRGELAAVDFLRAHRYQITECNWRCPLGEIDVICRSGDVLVFVEVKASEKAGRLPPEMRVNGRKRRKVRTLAAFYIKQRKLDLPCRFDVISVFWENDKPHVQHFENAF